MILPGQLQPGICPREKKDIGVNIKASKPGDDMKTIIKKELADEEYYDTYGILEDIVDVDIVLSLDDALREDIITGRRKRRLRDISIKIDPLYLQSIKKIATLKGEPYQTLMRQWLVENIRKELKIAQKRSTGIAIFGDTCKISDNKFSRRVAYF